MIRCYVKGQQCFITSPLVVAGTNKYLTLEVFFLTSNWKNRKKKVHFRKGGAYIGVELIDNKIDAERVPTLEPGIWEIGVEGIAVDGSRITTGIDTLKVKEGVNIEALEKLGL